MVRRTSRFVIVAVLTALLVGCTPGGGGGASAPPAATTQPDPANDGY